MSGLLKDNTVRLPELLELWEGAQHVPITKAMHLLWMTDRTLQKYFDLSTDIGQVGFAAWLMHCRKKFVGLYIKQHASRYEDFLRYIPSLAPVPTKELSSITLPIVLASIYVMRLDLQQAFDITTSEGKAGLCGNLFLADPWVHDVLCTTKNWLAEVIPEVDLPMILYALWLVRSDLQQAFDITTSEGKAGLCGNILLTNSVSYDILPAAGQWLTKVVPKVNLPLLAYALWSARSDLQNAFDIKTREGQVGLCRNLVQYNTWYRTMLSTNTK